jgi:large subunit ribosomal protein L17
MRHQVAGYKLGRSKGARTALRRTLIRQFFTHERITTTRTKAEAIRGEAERMITVARRSADAKADAKVAARRLVLSRLGGGDDVVKKLFDDIAPRFASRPGGYTRMLKLGPRHGDAAEMVILELVEE